MNKTVLINKQPDGLYTITTVEKDIALIDEKAPLPQPAPQPTKLIWERKTSFQTLPVGSSAREATGLTEAFSNTIIAMNGDVRCARMGVGIGEEGFGIWGGIMDHPTDLTEGNELTFTIETFFPVGFDFSANPRLKFLRVHTQSIASNEGYLDLYILPKGGFSHDSEVVGISSINNGGIPFGKPIVPGVWEKYEVFVKFSSSPGKGIYRVSQNGLMIYENTTQKTLKSTASYSDKSYIFTYWNDGAPKTQHMFVKQATLTAR